MGKGRSGRQDVLILTETNSIVDDRLNAEIGYAMSPDTVEAWALDSNQQAIDEETGNIVQVICERTYEPLIVFDLESQSGKSVVGKNVEAIASQKEDEEMAFMEQKKSRINMLLWIGIIATIFSLTISIIVLKSIL